MSTRLDIAKQVTELSGRFDLVTDALAGNYSNNGPVGIDFYINEGSKWLDENTQIHNQSVWFPQDIEVAQQLLIIPRLRTPQEVWMSKTDGDRWLLEKRSYGWIRQEYKHSGESNNEPKVWAPASVRMHESLHSLEFRGSELTTDGGFDDATKWTAAGGASVAGSALAFTGSAAGYATQDLSLVIGKRYEVIFTTIGRSAGNLRVYLGRNSKATAITTDATYTQEIIATGGSLYIVSDATFDGSVTSISVKEMQFASPLGITSGTSDKTFGKNYDRPGILWAPPSDAAYTVEILGLFFEKELSSDTDENYWSVVYPNALINTALMKIEEHHRNRAGVADYLSAVQSALRGPQNDLIAEEIAGSNQMDG